MRGAQLTHDFRLARTGGPVSLPELLRHSLRHGRSQRHERAGLVEHRNGDRGTQCASRASSRDTSILPGSSVIIRCAECSNHTTFFLGAFTFASHSAATSAFTFLSK